jgi:hypothetical protein
MLDKEIVTKIESFVYSKPRSVQEIAEYIGKNWRTADRYIDEIEKNFGTLSTRVFREGTRGALKIVYFASIEKASGTIFQENLEKEILTLKRKEDFSAFDIFQLVPEKNKKAEKEKAIDENHTNLNSLKEILESAEKQVLFFSGNLSFINLKNKNFSMLNTIENLIKEKIQIKIIARVDFTAKESLEKLLALNFKYGKEAIEIHHKDQPVRAMIIDNKIIRLKEQKEPTGKINELDDKMYIFYTIKDKEWAEWLSKIFWKIFSFSIDSKKRLEELNKIK